MDRRAAPMSSAQAQMMPNFGVHNLASNSRKKTIEADSEKRSAESAALDDPRNHINPKLLALGDSNQCSPAPINARKQIAEPAREPELFKHHLKKSVADARDRSGEINQDNDGDIGSLLKGIAA